MMHEDAPGGAEGKNVNVCGVFVGQVWAHGTLELVSMMEASWSPLDDRKLLFVSLQ